MSSGTEWTIVQKPQKKGKKQFGTKTEIETAGYSSATSCSFASGSSFSSSSSSSSKLTSSCLSSPVSSTFFCLSDLKIEKHRHESVEGLPNFFKTVRQTISNLSEVEYHTTLPKLKGYFETHFGNFEGKTKTIATTKDEQGNVLVCNCQIARHCLSVCVLSLISKKGQKAHFLLCTTFNNQIKNDEVYQQGPLMILGSQTKSESSGTTDEGEEKEENPPSTPKTSLFTMKFISSFYPSKFPNVPKVISEMLNCPFVVKIWATEKVPRNLWHNLLEKDQTPTNIFINVRTFLGCLSLLPFGKDLNLQKVSLPEIVSYFLSKSTKIEQSPKDAAFDHSVLLHCLAVSFGATSNTWPPVSTKSIQDFHILRLRRTVFDFLNRDIPI